MKLIIDKDPLISLISFQRDCELKARQDELVIVAISTPELPGETGDFDFKGFHETLAFFREKGELESEKDSEALDSENSETHCSPKVKNLMISN